jgi:hypothetical protein
LIVGNLKRGNCWRNERKQGNSGVSAEREGTREVTRVDAVCGEGAGEGVALDDVRIVGAVLTIIGCSSEIGGAIARKSAQKLPAESRYQCR